MLLQHKLLKEFHSVTSVVEPIAQCRVQLYFTQAKPATCVATFSRIVIKLLRKFHSLTVSLYSNFNQRGKTLNIIESYINIYKQYFKSLFHRYKVMNYTLDNNALKRKLTLFVTVTYHVLSVEHSKSFIET